jgi:hypothetical protein
VRAVDLTHPADTKQADDLVGSKPCSRMETHVAVESNLFIRPVATLRGESRSRPGSSTCSPYLDSLEFALLT